MITTTPDQLCPSCQVPLVTESQQVPWCERCEHNLGFFTGRRFERWADSLGFRLNRRLFHELSGQEHKRPELTSALLVLLAISMLLMAVFVAAVGVGAWLLVAGVVPMKLVGLLMLAVAWLLRPRLGRLKPLREQYDEITRAEAPHLFALIDATASAMGTKTPDHVFAGAQWNAFATVVGIRRRKAMMIGVPLWVSARPQERVLLLGHELGHFINRDVRRGLLTMPACTMFGNLADLVDPSRDSQGGWIGWGDDSLAGGVVRIGQLLSRPFVWVLTRSLRLTHIGIQVIAARQAQRAEYYADAVAVRLAGTKAISLFDLFSDALPSVVGSRARGGHGFDGWREAIEQARADQGSRVNRLRQLSLRLEASPFHHHPPYGLRHRMLAIAPYQDAQVVLTEAEAMRIDAELKRFERPYGNVLAHDW